MSLPTSPTNGQFYKQYIYNSTISAWQKLQAGIKESGTNSYGIYIWLIIETLIKLGSFGSAPASFSRGSNASSAYEPYYFPVVLHFPVNFINDEYALNFTAGLTNNNYPTEVGYMTLSRNTSTATVSIQSNYPYTGSVFHCTYMAIGKK